MSKTSSVIRPSNPNVCGHAMGIRSFRDSAKKLRFCLRDKATCSYHSK